MSDDIRVEISNTPGMFGCSLIGKRDIDEDFIICGNFGDIRAGILCDGMGGGSKGDVVSKIVAKGFLRGIKSFYDQKPDQWLSENMRHKAYNTLIGKCHDAVVRMSGKAGSSGTTITAVISTYQMKKPIFADIIHMGDSRCYDITELPATIITNDHSVTGDMLRAKYIDIHEISETSGNNILTRNIGDEHNSKAEISTIPLENDTKFLICCDGVWSPLHQENGLLLPDPPHDNQKSVDDIVNRALEEGSTDNCSALIINC